MILTQANWLRMPARDPARSLEGPNGTQVGTTFELFKRHKSLPHPREDRILDLHSFNQSINPRSLTLDTEIPSFPSSDTSSPRTLKHTSKRIGAPGLPPTPPTHSRQPSGTHQTITSPPKFETKSKSTSKAPSAPGTPPNQKSPPTPDVTPPRAMPPLAFRPPASDRYPSSRTDSFKTARENPYSSDDDEVSTVRPTLPSAKPSEIEVRQHLDRSQRRKEVGLGLGLESDEGTTTPRPHPDSQKEFVVFDGEWGSAGEEVSEVEREWDDNLMRNVTVRKRPINTQFLEDDLIVATNATRVVRSLPLHERIARHRLEREGENSNEHILWRLEMADPRSCTPDGRRFSAGRSANSTVIEAMVVDAPPLRRKTLRHTKKQIGLRDFSSDKSMTISASNSANSSEVQQKLVDKNLIVPERVGRRHQNLASNPTMSTASSSDQSQQDILSNGRIPVIVVPDRRSSIKSSKAPSLRSTSSRRTKRSISLSSAPLSYSSKFNDPGYFDTLPPRKRTMSESAGSTHSVRTLDFPPNIPTRRSSLSAPTSRNTSRTGSLTTESLKAHSLVQRKNRDVHQPNTIENRPFADSQGETSQHTRLIVDHNGDPFFGNRPSAQVTPFSQTSYETAGTTAEVSEAMAVSIFPHQNKSIIVVQQQAAPTQIAHSVLEGFAYHEGSTSDSKPKISFNGKSSSGPVTPPQPTHLMDNVDSPLRNPRQPPEPPTIKFIPPTPAALTPGQEENRQLGYNEDRPANSKSKTRRGISLVRRAFSNRRRNSKPSGDGFLKRTVSLSGRQNDSAQTSRGTTGPITLYPPVTDRPADGSKLHPFWRPAHFWDDLEDRGNIKDDEFGGRYPIIDNRPAPPRRSLSGKLKRTFAILPITDDTYDHAKIDRRAVRRTLSTNVGVVKQRSQSSLTRGETGDYRRYGEPVDAEQRFGYGFKEGNRGRVHTIPGLGVRVEYVGWGGMKRKLNQKKKQYKSESLRTNISNPIRI